MTASASSTTARRRGRTRRRTMPPRSSRTGCCGAASCGSWGCGWSEEQPCAAVWRRVLIVIPRPSGPREPGIHIHRQAWGSHSLHYSHTFARIQMAPHQPPGGQPLPHVTTFSSQPSRSALGEDAVMERCPNCRFERALYTSSLEGLREAPGSDIAATFHRSSKCCMFSDRRPPRACSVALFARRDVAGRHNNPAGQEH